MRLKEPIDIMLNCCIPDKKKLALELSKLAPGEVVQIQIDNCITSRTMVENYVKNKLCRIVKVIDQENSSILHIKLEVNA